MHHTRQLDRSLGEGVYYSRHAYVGAWRRIGIVLIDGAVIYVSIVLGAIGIASLRQWVNVPGIDGLLILGLLWFYFVGTKILGLQTPGYRCTGCRLVDLKGKRPSFLAATSRECLWLAFGPLFFFDFLWCGIDSCRQSLRDCLSGTILIRSGAHPLGAAPLHLTKIFTLCYLFFYPRVQHLHGVVLNGRDYEKAAA